MKRIKVILLGWAFVANIGPLQAQGLSMSLSLKTPGNPSETRQLQQQGQYWATDGPLNVVSSTAKDGDDELLTVTLSAREKVYFHLDLSLNTGLSSSETEFYMPGFWYHRNMRSPQEAPSFKTSKHWSFREDRMSTPLTSAFNPHDGQGISVLRVLDTPCDVQVQLTTGEIILPGRTSVGYAGFDGEGNTVALKFGYPYKETPKRYIRKLTLIDPVTAFAKLEKDEQQTLRWRIHRYKANDFGSFVTQVWQYSYDRMQPQPLKSAYTSAEVKAALSDYFRHSFVDRYPLKYNSGLSLRVNDCLPETEMQIGFCGRVLLNAFNEIEYGVETKDEELVNKGQAIFDSFLSNGFGEGGYLHDFVNFRDGFPKESIHSIRQVELNRNNTAKADPVTLQTADPDIFVGGDVYTGPRFAIDAIAAGRIVEDSINRFVHPGQSMTINRDLRHFIELNKDDVVLEEFDTAKRQVPGHKQGNPKTTFNDMRLAFTDEQVRTEAKRCLGCGATFVDLNKCIGCGLCTTRCEFDAIHLQRDLPDASRMYRCEDKIKAILPYAAKRKLKILFKKKSK